MVVIDLVLKNSPRNLMDSPIRGKYISKIIFQVARRQNSQSSSKMKPLITVSNVVSRLKIPIILSMALAPCKPCLDQCHHAVYPLSVLRLPPQINHQLHRHSLIRTGGFHTCSASLCAGTAICPDCSSRRAFSIPFLPHCMWLCWRHQQDFLTLNSL